VADLCLVTLRRDMTTPVVPSKILGFMAGARPIVAALPPGNDAATLIEAARCGLCVLAGDEEALAEAIIILHRDGDLRAAMGRQGRLFAQTHLDRDILIRRCEELMATAVARQYQPRP
jgi:colanic acid biosynthesis glycosyl transferase WcaI